ncbi:cell division transpeptidase FtsI [Gluconobacter thailandicus F149-1 = NBRC 100600]|uniref:Cell division transpeptidase FtsI n=1 Tax=Gluconobacter thailandicus NBRC 3257 TaxID=1381097 RepID=A0ABQ0ISJ6_GLUTH|nr:penicillin-binding protein 2 [Gluconobacter thailandicus]KXV53358.1 cell division protein FtsI [Gluconobacter thailandicus]GAC88362.1 cell division transpeptidase FtsI [Gluconobacter thailandicus NBRC 3255]GAD25191.1 cell division transpeptidase FtsI [Gluconobacter thailandicus NBRC 3257]GAN94450.1 cell division transpeptidase FtsI [Gluconobacter thailandicus F149-1 = NBRC 100600]GEL87406.1 peptidoglycan glycosyltransferase [Gluconobacter thailandicus F149-1 = NBRC 100600]
MPQDVPPSSGSHRAARQNKRAEQRGSQAAGPKLSSRRLNLDQMHGRLLVAGMGFLAIYGAVALKATFATVLMPMEPEKRQIAPQVPEIPKSDPRGEMAGDFVLPSVKRATITDRNGQALALSLPVAQVYANPMELIDPEEAAKKLKTVLPKLDEAETVRRLSLKKQFVYIARDISPVQEIAINNLGIPGIYFEAGERRHYPLGRTAAQIMGSVDIDDHGIAGVERFFDQRLNSDRTPLRLSLDVRVQAVAHDELAAAKDEFSAIGASAIVMDVRTGEILAMVSLPDYDANEFNHAPNDARFNRAVTGMYEPGSTFKLQTAAMGLQLGVVHIWDRFSTIPIRVGRFTIRDMKTDHFAPWLSLPGVLAYSSNPAAAHIALDVGAQRQQEWLRGMGFFNRVPVELPEAGRPLVPASKNWGISTVMTVGFGHGVAEPPLAIVRGTAATVNGGILLKPTLVARDQQDEAQTPDAKLRPVAYKPDETDNGDDIGAQTPVGTRVLSEKTSALLRKLLRLDVTVGSGKSAEVPGYYVGGKTGTAEKIGAHGGYLKHVNVSAFTSVFPMNNPHYAVYVMLDSPQGTAATHGWTTAAWNAAPTVKKIISRVGPILNQFPDTANKDAIEASLAIPMNPSVPTGYRALGPGNDPGDPRNQAHSSKTQH